MDFRTIGFQLAAGMAILCGSSARAEVAVEFTVDLGRNVRPISPLIYGNNYGEFTADDGVTFFRSGGNRLTGYNWENNASHAGLDWEHSNDNHLGGGNVPGKAITDFHDGNLAAGARSIITLPAAGYVAKDKKGAVSAAETAPSSRWAKVVHEKGAPFAAVPDTTDNNVYTDEFVDFLVKKYGAATSERGIKHYSVDNEPGLWSHTHPRIHPDTTGAAELVEKTVAVAKVVKKIDPMGEVFAGVFYGYAAYQSLQNAPDWETVNAGNKYAWYLEYFLDEMKKASDLAGKRLVDVLDIHWYPESTGDIRIIETGATSPKDNAARVQAPRSLWDTSYAENSWISKWATPKQPVTNWDDPTPGPINLLPRVFASIDKYNPGTRLAITEYNYGAADQISGGLAQADFLGVLGASGVYAANFWQLNLKPTYVASAFRLFRNYDGQKSAFGSLSAWAAASDKENAGVYAAYDAGGDKVHILVVNRNPAESLRGTFKVTSPAPLTGGKVFGFDASGTAVSEKAAVASITGNTFTYLLAPYSASHFVLRTSAALPTSLSRRAALSPAGKSMGGNAAFYLPDGKKTREAEGRRIPVPTLPRFTD